MVQRRGEELSIDALNDMEVLGRNMTEALRLFPPLIMLLRAAKVSFTVTDSSGKTFVIPKVRCTPDPSKGSWIKQSRGHCMAPCGVLHFKKVCGCSLEQGVLVSEGKARLRWMSDV